MNWNAIKIKANVQLKFLKDHQLPIQIGFLSCPSKIEGFPSENLWDVRIMVTSDFVNKDEVIETKIAFLSPDVAEKYLRKGAKIILKGSDDFAVGEITELLY
jgi:hypothetical protein